MSKADNRLPEAFKKYIDEKLIRLKKRLANLESGKLITSEENIGSGQMESTTDREAHETREEIKAIEELLGN